MGRRRIILTLALAALAAVAIVGAALQLAQQRRRHPRACRAERVAERDAAAIRVDVPSAILEAGVLQELEHDRGKGLVDLDDGDVIPRELRAGERLRAGLG